MICPDTLTRSSRYFGRLGQMLLLCMVMSWHANTFASDTSTQAPRLLDTDHPLVDRIWDVQAGIFIGREKFTERLLDNEYLLLGETHDNSRHHDIQAWVIEKLHSAHRVVSVSFEMINDAQGEALRSRNITTVDELLGVIQHIDDSWPYARDYRIVFDGALRAGFSLRAANLRRDTLRRFAREGDASLPQDIRVHLQQAPLSVQQQRALAEDIVSAHCDMIPAEVAQPMVNVQRVRDAVMSLGLLQSSANVKVLIAGAGHVRKDYGVPFYLRSHSDSLSSLALGMIEVRPEHDKPTDYTERWNTPALPFDYVWFTPRAERADPCASLRTKMQR